MGPYPSPPLPNFQCHPVGVVSKKHSTEWRTIYHLSYPQGTTINDHILKDTYSLSYVRFDDAISILQTLGRGAFMAKTDLKSAFRLIPIHPKFQTTGACWVSSGNPITTLICSFPLVSAVCHSSLINFPTGWNGFLKTTMASSMFFISWMTSLLWNSQNCPAFLALAPY